MSGFLLGGAGIEEAAVERAAAVVAGREDKNPHVYTAGGVSIVSSRPVVERNGVVVGFDGILLSTEDEPERYIAEMYKEHGTDFVERLNGSFRAIVYDEDAGRCVGATDKASKKVLYHAEEDGKIVFSSHLTPLLSIPWIEAEIDYNAVSAFIANWSMSFGGGKRLIDGVERLDPGTIAVYNGRELQQKEIWDVYHSEKRDVSDAVAEKHIEALLEEAAQKMVEEADTLDVLLSGGIDSAFLVALLRETTDRPINTYTYGGKPRHFEEGREVAELYGTNHTTVHLSYSLMDAETMWLYEEPQNVFMLYPFDRMYKSGMKEFWTGLYSHVPFPVGMQNIWRLEKARFLQPMFRKVGSRRVADVAERIDGKLGKAVDILGSDYESAVMLNDWSLRQGRVSRFYGERLEGGKESRAAELDRELGLERRPYPENYSYLQLKVRETSRFAFYSQLMENYSVYSYTPLIEYACSLPMTQRRERRMLRRVSRGRVPERIIEKEASGQGFVVEQLKRKIRNDKDRYRERIERFLERDLLNQRSRAVLLPPSVEEQTEGEIHFMCAVYLLELWLEVFADREDPWRSPG